MTASCTFTSDTLRSGSSLQRRHPDVGFARAMLEVNPLIIVRDRRSSQRFIGGGQELPNLLRDAVDQVELTSRRENQPAAVAKPDRELAVVGQAGVGPCCQ